MCFDFNFLVVYLESRPLLSPGSLPHAAERHVLNDWLARSRIPPFFFRSEEVLRIQGVQGVRGVRGRGPCALHSLRHDKSYYTALFLIFGIFLAIEAFLSSHICATVIVDRLIGYPSPVLLILTSFDVVSDGVFSTEGCLGRLGSWSSNPGSRPRKTLSNPSKAQHSS